MTKDELVEDLMILTCSDIVSGRRFRKEVEAIAPEGKDPKQHVVDQVMAELEKINRRVEPDRLREKKKIWDYNCQTDFRHQVITGSKPLCSR